MRDQSVADLNIQFRSFEKSNLVEEFKSKQVLGENGIVGHHRDHFWIPEELTPMFHLPSYRKLKSAHLIRYNQLVAIGVIEQFIWFEGPWLGSLLPTLIARNENPELQEALKHFLREEHRHLELFRYLLQAVEPEWYKNRSASVEPLSEFRLMRTSTAQNLLSYLTKAFPETFPVWVFMAIAIEERSLYTSRKYLQEASRDRDEISAAFVQAHRLHLKDEVRHVAMDVHLVEEYYRKVPSWVRHQTAFIFGKIVKAYSAPKRLPHRILEVLKLEFSDLDSRVAQDLRKEMTEMDYQKRYHQVAFGRAVVPRTRQLLDQFEEFDGLFLD